MRLAAPIWVPYMATGGGGGHVCKHIYIHIYTDTAGGLEQGPGSTTVNAPKNQTSSFLGGRLAQTSLRLPAVCDPQAMQRRLWSVHLATVPLPDTGGGDEGTMAYVYSACPIDLRGRRCAHVGGGGARGPEDRALGGHGPKGHRGLMCNAKPQAWPGTSQLHDTSVSQGTGRGGHLRLGKGGGGLA